MWPFRKNRPAGGSDDALEIIDQAIDFAAERWRYFSRSVVLAPDPGLRDRIGVFARSIEQSLHARFPPLTAAPEEVILLIIAKGVEQAGQIARQDIERALGILLPP